MSLKKCGHFCSNSSPKLCCRCHTPNNGERWLAWWEVCKICKWVLLKHPNGLHTQKCPDCGKIILTLDRYERPVGAPLANCGCKLDKLIKNKVINKR